MTKAKHETKKLKSITVTFDSISFDAPPRFDNAQFTVKHGKMKVSANRLIYPLTICLDRNDNRSASRS
jgi:hypothetical protein